MKLTRWLPTLERLEAREVPAVTAALSQIANWQDIGPNNVTGGQVRGITTNSAIGAVSALVPHPTLATTMFAAGVNGGVWRTENALDASPIWVPLTDALASLSVSDLTIDPDNPNRLLAGIGSTADQPGTTTIGTLGNQEARIRGDRIGVLYTENALAATPTWTVLNNNIAGKLVTNVVLRGGYMIVATDLGTFRSTNNGATFANVYPSTIDNGQTFQTRAFDQGAYDLAENSRLRDQLYLATKPGAGLGTNHVWRSDDGGASWGTVTDPQMQLSPRTVNVQVSVRDAGAFDNQVYVAVSNSNPTVDPIDTVLNERATTGVGFQYAWESRAGNVSSICYSPNQGGTWIRLDAPRQETAALRGAFNNNTTSGVVTVTTGPEHRLQSGDKVRVSGNITRILSYDAMTGVAMFDPPPNGPIVIENTNNYYLVDVTGPNTFTLRGLTITGGTGNFTALAYGAPPPFGSIPGNWVRVVGASSGENPEFLQIQASRTSPFEVYLGGDSRQWNFDQTTPLLPASTYNGPTTFTGSVWVGNLSVNPTGFGANESNSTQWTTLTDSGTNNNTGTRTAPGADTRELIFDAAGNMWIATGTGVYRRTNLTGSGNWVSANGNLSLGQFYDAAFDTISNVVVGATQDTGAIESNTALSNTYRSITSAADRNRQRDQEHAYESVVDDRSFAGSGFSVRYTASNNFGNVRRREMLPNNTLRGVAGDDTTLNFANAFTTNTPLSGITLTDGNLFRDASARIVMELSATNPTRAVYGLTSVYEDSDPNGVTGFIVRNVTPGGMTGRVRTMKYSGQRPGGIQSQLNQVMAVGTSTGQLWVRGEVGPTFNNLTPPLGTGEVTDIEFDPDDWRHMFIARGGRVWETTNANDLSGAGAWRDVTAGLVTAPLPGTDLPSGLGLTTEIRTIALFDPVPGTSNIGATNDVILLAGGRGGVFRRTLTVCGTGTVWSEYGSGLPNTVVNDLGFASNGFRLTAATFGRGVWSIPDVRPTLNATLTLFITSDAAGDSIVVSADPLDQNAVLVTANGSQIGRFTFGQFDRIVVNANGGADTVQIGSGTSTLFVNYPIGVHMGGDVGDTLIVESNGSTANVQATIDGGTVGANKAGGDNLFSGCGSLTYTGLVAGSTLRLLTGSGDDYVLLAAGTYPQTIETNTGSGNDTVQLFASSNVTVNAIDGAGTNDTLQVSVPQGQTVTGSPSGLVISGGLVVNTNGGFENLIYTGEGAGANILWGGSGLDDDFYLMADPTFANFSQLIILAPNTTATPQRVRFFNMTALTVDAGAGNDRLIVDANGPALGGTTKFVNYLVNAAMGGQGGDQIILDDGSSLTPSSTTVTGNSVGVGGTLFGTNGQLYFSGLSAGRLYLTTGNADDTAIFDVTAALNVTLNGGGGSNAAVFSGTAGNDAVNVGFPTVQVNALTVSTANEQTFQVVGNGGFDQLNVGGSAGDDTLVVNQAGVQSGDLGGLPVRLEYSTLELLNLIPYGGTNSLIWHDVSNSVFGAPTNPGVGVEFLPTGAASGRVRLGGGAGTTVSFDSVNGGFVMNGDATGSNTGDVLSVFGVSTAGLATFGEAQSANGSDTISATEDGVTITNAVLGTLRPVQFGRTAGGRLGFINVWVRGGNEAGTGDAFTSAPTLRTNLLLDGGNPASPPGDTLTVTTNGPASSGPSTDPNMGPPHTRITNRGDRASVGHLNFETVTAVTPDPTNPGGPPVPSFGSAKADLFAVGTNGNTPATVNAYNLNGTLRFSLNPFPGYGGAVQVAVGDVTGDGKSDVVVAAGPGGGPHVKVFDGQTQAEVRSFFAYDAAFTGGVTVAVGNFNTDTFADIVTGTATGAPHVKVFNGQTLGTMQSFFAYNLGFTNGVNVGAGDVNGDGVSDVITGTAAGSQPVVRVFNGTNVAPLRDFFAFDSGFLGGVNVAAGDLNGDGRAEIVVGAGPGGGPHVRAFDGATNAEVVGFFANVPYQPGAGPTTFTGGVSVAVGDFDNDGLADILTGTGPNQSAAARVLKVSNGISDLFTVGSPFGGYTGGITVGA